MSKASRKVATKEQLAKGNDAGPHLVTLPSKRTVRIRIPDTGALIRSGRLPEHLRETALMIAGHGEGAEGYFADRVSAAIVRGDDAVNALTAKAIADGLELGNVLVAEMLVEPAVSVEDVEAGMFGELDVKMLLEIAERRRSLDAEGNRIPVLTLDEWATFRHVPDRAQGPDDGEAARDDAARDRAPAGAAV